MIKVYFKKIYLSKDLLRNSKLYSKHFRTTNNSNLILPLYLWKTIEIYNGKQYIPISVNKKKIGFILKNFIFSRKNNFYTSDFTIKINK